MPKEMKKKENKTKKVSKEKKHFFKDTKAELKKVIWPTSKQLLNNTLAVISIVLIIGVVVFVLDVCFEKMNTYGINKIKSVVQSNEISENAESNSENVDDIEVNEENASEDETIETTEIEESTIAE